MALVGAKKVFQLEASGFCTVLRVMEGYGQWLQGMGELRLLLPDEGRGPCWIRTVNPHAHAFSHSDPEGTSKHVMSA